MGDLITQSPWTAISSRSPQLEAAVACRRSLSGAKSETHCSRLLAESMLVVDASLSAVRAGITHPGALLKLRKRGVRVFTAPLLHAKVFAFDSVGFVGSTNASTRSRDHLREAVVRIADAPTLVDIRNYVDELATDELSRADLEWLRKQYSSPSPSHCRRFQMRDIGVS